MPDKIKRFIECFIPVSICNLKCDYCYVIQEGNRSMKKPEFLYSQEKMKTAFGQDRWGGKCYFSICGAGETLLPKETLFFVKTLLGEGHYVNITTNGTITARFAELAKLPSEYLERLHIAFSFHYLELKNKNLIDVFFNNIKLMREKKASFTVQFNLYDGYIPYLEEIYDLCVMHVGAPPQVALTRDETGDQIKVMSQYPDKYRDAGKLFASPLFDFTNDNFMIKRTEFCYAGEWSFTLDLAKGDLRQCYNKGILCNIYEDMSAPIKTKVAGCTCSLPYCINSSHFLSLGVIPGIKTPSYAQLRNRERAHWYSDRMKSFLNSRLYESNHEYTKEEQDAIMLEYKKNRVKYKILSKLTFGKIRKKYKALSKG